MPAAGNDAEHHDLVFKHPVEDAVGESPEERAPCLAPHARVGKGMFDDTLDRRLHGYGESLSETRPLPVVPVP